MNGPHEYTYFIDRDLGARFPALLRAAGLKVERLDEHFPPDAPDDVWLGEIARIAKIRRDGVQLWVRQSDWLKSRR